MAQMIFDEKSMYEGSLFKFEQRLHTPLDRYIEKGGLLTKYFSQDENTSTVDRGIQDIEALFGSNAPLRYNLIDDFPLYGFQQATPEDGSDENLEDFNVEGDCIILPSTIIPKPWDFFVIKHLKQLGIFSVRSVSYDTMKPEGYYKIHYKLQSTSREVLQKLENQVVNKYNTELNALGTNVNPIIREDDFVLKEKIKKILASMIYAYRSIFYNERHNCFLYKDPNLGMNIFDMCGNEFMAKHGLMNSENSNRVIMLQDKLYDQGLRLKYLLSPYYWLEIDAPIHRIRKFKYSLISSKAYSFSSFTQWHDEVLVMNPLDDDNYINLPNIGFIFDNDIFISLEGRIIPKNPYELLLWKFIHRDNLTIHDIPLDIAEVLLNGNDERYIWLYTPMIIFIIKKILMMP